GGKIERRVAAAAIDGSWIFSAHLGVAVAELPGAAVQRVREVNEDSIAAERAIVIDEIARRANDEPRDEDRLVVLPRVDEIVWIEDGAWLGGGGGGEKECRGV